MYERFTDRAHRVVVLAQEAARMHKHSYIGTEHILLGLIGAGEGVAAKALESLGIGLEEVRQQVDDIIGHGQQAPRRIPFASGAKKAFELSLRESLQLGHDYIGTEHILLGLIREGEGVAAQVLIRNGADLNQVREQMIRLLARGARAGMNTHDSRQSVIEQWAETGPVSADLDEQIAQVRQDKETAIDAEDYEQAKSLSERERQLLSDKTARQQH